MPLDAGQRLPEADFLTMSAKGPETVKLSERLAGKRVVLFALPGAFTGACSTAHMPSFTRTADAFREKGVDEILCLAVNDPFTLAAWAKDTGADEAGITMLADADGSFTEALGMAFNAPHVGLYNRSNRYALLIEDGVISQANIDEPGVCEMSTGEALLATL